MKKILFIDRDGTLCEEPEDFQVDRIDKIKLMPQVIPSLLTLSQHGFRFVMISNQDGLGTASFPQKDFAEPHEFLLDLLTSQGIQFDEILICPHLPEDQCVCRKPNVGLVQAYLADPNWDRQRSYVIGDRPTDITLAERMSIGGLLIARDPKPENTLSWPDIVARLIGQPRQATIKRQTQETQIEVAVNLDVPGQQNIATGIGFFDHMLEQLAKHGGFSLTVQCAGDLHVDDHHAIEDCGLAIGEAIRKALGDKVNIGRYGFVLPMDETEAQVSLDLSGRPYFVFKGNFSREYVGHLATEMIPHFFRSLAEALGANLHIQVQGENEHHKAEAMFKCVARSLRQAVQTNQLAEGLPSTKGVL
jgi:imidazoleglycerol-phosphate dehydratase/histidinol-phosphatase